MPSETPVRRFSPTPVETSTKSSRPNNTQGPASTQKPRKFTAEPVETSSKTNRNDPQEATQRPPRRFSPQPVETSSKSSRKPEEAPKKPLSRFAPQPFETTIKSSKKSGQTQSKPKSRFAPEPFETTTKTSRRSPAAAEEPTSPKSTPVNASNDKPVRRKFAPVLIDTSQRSRKSVDDKPTYSEIHKTDVTPGVVKPSYHNSGQQLRFADTSNSATPEHASRFLMPFERRRDRSLSQSSGRAHSFRMPDLETIESSESEPSNPPSLSSSPSEDGSPLTTSDSVSDNYKHATRMRESVDEGVAGYMLMIEARRAEEKLREQALAAFPNSDFHEQVAHYVDDEEDSDEMEIDDRPATWEGHDDDEYDLPTRRRQSTVANWELKEMRDHHAQLEQERNAAKTTARRKSTANSPWWNTAATDYASAGNQQDPEMRNMRDRARPPMLGGDLRFPRSASPEPARFDVTQGSHKLRNQMCYLSEQSGNQNGDADGLWGQQPQKTKTGRSGRSSKTSNGQGLWGGFCVDEHKDDETGLKPQLNQLQTGLMTPRVENGNPFEREHNVSDRLAPVPVPPDIVLPLTPPESEALNIAGVLQSEKDLDELMKRDYPDTFITQVYNYLSLGYPSLARPFDDELAKISGVPMSDLRHDDDIAKSMPKGYIRLGDDFEGRGDGIDQELKEGGCARWKALKLYIREWARQEKNMVRDVSIGGNWGTGARRGSWAW